MFTNAELEIIFEAAVAMLLGGLIGFERETANKPAGFRTHMLIAGAAAVLVGLSDALVLRFSANTPPNLIQSDPVRIVEAVITGISFLGAGTIFRRRDNQVEGLTTAASMLFSAAIGVSVALRQFGLAVGISLLTLIALRGLSIVEAWVDKASGDK